MNDNKYIGIFEYINENGDAMGYDYILQNLNDNKYYPATCYNIGYAITGDGFENIEDLYENRYNEVLNEYDL